MSTPAINRFQKLVDNISRLYTNARKSQVRLAWETRRQGHKSGLDNTLYNTYTIW